MTLVAQHVYKQGFNWWVCRNCNRCGWYELSQMTHDGCGNYVPYILDELGDWWYYFRVTCYLYGEPTRWVVGENYNSYDIDQLLALMAQNSAVMLGDWLDKTVGRFAAQGLVGLF